MQNPSTEAGQFGGSSSSQSPRGAGLASQNPGQSARPSAEPLVLNFVAVCKYLGVSESTGHRLRKQPDFPAPRVLGPQTLRWVTTEVAEWVRSRAPKVDPATVKEPTFLSAARAARRAGGRA